MRPARANFMAWAVLLATASIPALSVAGDLVERGAYLAIVGNCAGCHSTPGGDPYAGGVEFVTDFGTIYSTNITSHPQAGLGEWSYHQFARAMREGVDAQGRHLYPVFPYPSFANITDADLQALHAYIATLAPSPAAPPANQLRFPYNQRWLLSVWKLLFHDAAAYQSAAEQSPQWNRGAYLVEGLAHCGACHTPRNALGAENRRRALSGGVLNHEVMPGRVRRWSASNLTSARSGLAAWNAGDLVSYLQTGHGPRAGTFGPMKAVVGHSTSRLTEEDLQGIETYLKSLPPIEPSPEYTMTAEQRRVGEIQYTIHCGTCHMPTGLGSTPGSELGPPLVGSAIVQAADPSSLINIILYGAEVLPGASSNGWQNKQPLGSRLRNDQVAAIATYVRNHWGNLGGPVSEADVARQR